MGIIEVIRDVGLVHGFLAKSFLSLGGTCCKPQAMRFKKVRKTVAG